MTDKHNKPKEEEQKPLAVEPAPVPKPLTDLERVHLHELQVTSALQARELAKTQADAKAKVDAAEAEVAQYKRTTTDRILLTEEEADAWPDLEKIMEHNRVFGKFSELEGKRLTSLINHVKDSIVFPGKPKP